MTATGEPYAIASQVDDKDLIEKRRAQIVAAATELFGRHGFHRTTIKDIAARAGVSIGLIYQYVRDKEDVLLLVVSEVVDAYGREIPIAIACETDPVERCKAAVRAYCRVVDTHRGATLLGYRDTFSLDEPRRRIIMEKELQTNTLISVCVQDCVDAGRFRPVNVELVAYQLVMVAHAWALKSWRLREVSTLEEYVEHCLGVVLDGLLTDRR